MQDDNRLHADHIDTSGAYAKRFEVIRELVENGTLSEIPVEFKLTKTNHEIIDVQSNEENQEFLFFDKFGNKHADHTDETGRYKKAWESKFGPLGNSEIQESPQQNEWKEFLQKLIEEEKSKLTI